MGYTKVIYIGLIKDETTNVVGGFATANSRNIKEYKTRGFQVEEIGYPVLKNKNFISIIHHLIDWLKLLYKCFKIAKKNKSNRDKTIIHITPFYKYFIVIENIIVKIHSIYNKNILIDIRAGSFELYYQNYSIIYKKILNSFLNTSMYITVEGEKYIDFIQKTLNKKKPIHYYPNYVKDDEILRTPRTFNNINLKLIYFGRLDDTKGIHLIVETHKLLKEKYNVETILIGNGNEEYLKFIKELSNRENIKILLPQKKEVINCYLLKSHFFVFPTTHQGEGHSNALTEAMAYGVVPIVSNNGFNKQVIKNAGVTLEINATANDYFGEIDKILTNKLWLKLSENSRHRVIDNFSNSAVSESFFNFLNLNKK